MAAQSLQNLPTNPSTAGVLPPTLADAQRAIRANQFARAESILRLSLERNDAAAETEYLLAYTLLREGKPKESLTEYTKAASLRKPTADDLRSVAQNYVLLGDNDDADRWLTLSLKMAPSNVDTLYNLGRLRYTQNRFADAVDYFQRVLVLVPRNVKAENNLGLAYEGLDRPHEAEAAYRQALAWQTADPGTPASEQPFLNLAILLLHSGQSTEARDLLAHAVAISPKDPRIHEQLGQLYSHDAKFQEASQEFKTASDLDPNRSSLHFLLGQAYKHLGRSTDATAEFAKASALAHTLPEDGSR